MCKSIVDITHIMQFHEENYFRYIFDIACSEIFSIQCLMSKDVRMD